MCAWWTGQPVYGSNPVSKFVRENFAWLKNLVDAHEITLAGITADAAEINILDGATITTAQLNNVTLLAGVTAESLAQIKSMRITYNNTGVGSGNLTVSSNYNGETVGATAIVASYDGVAWNITAAAAACRFTLKDAAITGTIKAVLAVIPVFYPHFDMSASVVGATIVFAPTLLISGNQSTTNVLSLLNSAGGGVWDVLYIAY